MAVTVGLGAGKTFCIRRVYCRTMQCYGGTIKSIHMYFKEMKLELKCIHKACLLIGSENIEMTHQILSEDIME